MKKPIVAVSDHAIIRYLEKVQGVDIESIRRDIGRRIDTAHRRGEVIETLPVASGVIMDGFAYLIAGGVCVTVQPVKKAKVLIARVREDG